MSVPAFAWAIEQGRCRDLEPLERWVLAILADRANGARVCWPSQRTLVADTGLSLRSVRNILHRLATIGLIRLEDMSGKVTRYHVLRPDEPRHDVPGSRPNGHDKTPAPHAGVEVQTPAPRAATPAPHAGDPGTTCRRTLKEPRKEPKTRASRSEPAATSQRSDGALAAAPSQPTNQSGTPPPVVSEEAPMAPHAVRSLVLGVTGALRVAPPPRAAPPEPDIPVRRGPVDAIRTVEQQQAQLAIWIAQEAAANAARLHGAVS